MVFWLILKWENRADLPHSDKYLVLIAYVIGISIAVHLLNLLCIPAIVLVVYYRKWKNTTGKGSLAALLVSCVIVGLILYGLVPGFIEIAQYFELLFVNVFHFGFNSGTLIYAFLLVCSFVWAIHSLYRQKNLSAIRWSVLVSITLSGMLFIGDSLWIAFVLTAALVWWLFTAKKLPVRILTLVVMSTFVIFIGYSSYALLLIRSSAHTPMNQNAPDNVFSLASYLNREQYGDRPLFYGMTLNSEPVYQIANGVQQPVVKEGKALYEKTVKSSDDEPDSYTLTGYKKDYTMTPELNMLFPRIYSSTDPHPDAYRDWIGMRGRPVEATAYVDADGNAIQKKTLIKPTFAENLQFFLTYQLNHMYWRYFMWNFAGRQNDIQGNGEVNQGNWISGIPFIDNLRLGDQSLLPDEYGKGNKGHNVFFMLPLLLGIIGLGWQAFTSKRGIEQFWVVFFLFFMTGIAIVLYLNQTPSQPRERDYAFAGSFYAYAIWIGMGVAGLWRMFMSLFAGDSKKVTESKKNRMKLIGAAVACVIGLLVPLQMVSQTWDDHDRSNRYTTRDFGNNYLNSLDENAIVFTNGDNDTFPLWYAQEVEGTRTDVKVVNLSYLTTPWYVDQIRMPSYEAPGIDMQAKPTDYAYDKLQYSYVLSPDTMSVNVLSSLRNLYSPEARTNEWGVPIIKYANMYVPVDTEAMVKAGRINADEAAAADELIPIDMTATRGLTLSQVMALDMIGTSAANGWNRPVYFAMTVPERYYLGLSPYLRNTGLAYEVGPIRNPNGEVGVNLDKMYTNITEKWQWGGLDKVDDPSKIYLDETVRRMVTTHRSAMLDLATAYLMQALESEMMLDRDSAGTYLNDFSRAELPKIKADSYSRALKILDLMREKLPESAMPYSVSVGQSIGDLYLRIGEATGNDDATETGLEILRKEIDRYARNVVYYQSLSPSQYNTLPVADRYIDQTYLLVLFQTYAAGGGDADEMQQHLEDLGVDIARMARFQQRTK